MACPLYIRHEPLKMWKGLSALWFSRLGQSFVLFFATLQITGYGYASDKTSEQSFAGPSAYNISRAVGERAKLSNERSVQSAKIGTNPRFGPNESSTSHQALPGPGQYGNPNVQVVSHHSALPRVGFTKAHRDANKKVETYRVDFICRLVLQTISSNWLLWSHYIHESQFSFDSGEYLLLSCGNWFVWSGVESCCIWSHQDTWTQSWRTEKGHYEPDVLTDNKIWKWSSPPSSSLDITVCYLLPCVQEWEWPQFCVKIDTRLSLPVCRSSSVLIMRKQLMANARLALVRLILANHVASNLCPEQKVHLAGALAQGKDHLSYWMMDQGQESIMPELQYRVILRAIFGLLVLIEIRCWACFISASPGWINGQIAYQNAYTRQNNMQENNCWHHVFNIQWIAPAGVILGHVFHDKHSSLWQEA